MGNPFAGAIDTPAGRLAGGLASLQFNQMKTLSVKDAHGSPVKGWSFGAFRNHWNVGGNLPHAKRISGWSIRSHDGVERFCEGNWQQFVPFAQLIISNYGFTSALS